MNQMAMIGVALTVLSLTVLALSATVAGAETAADRFHPVRGLNFDIWVDWRTTDDMLATPGFLTPYPDWRRHVSDADIAAIAPQGYDFARLPMDPAPLLAVGPGTRQDALIADIVQSARIVQDSGVKVIVDLHVFPRPDDDWGVDSILSDPARLDAYVTLVGRVAGALNGMDPDRTAFEVMNEPTVDCDAIWGAASPVWPVYLARLHRAARDGAPDLPLVLSGACWGGAEGLAALDPATIADDNVIWSFHSYTPFLFTHQGADWTGGIAAVLHHVPYPPTLLSWANARALARDAAAWGRAQGIVTDPPAITGNVQSALEDYRATPDGNVAADGALAARWADRHGIPHHRLLLGEFGAITSPEDTEQDRASRLRFLLAKRQSAQALGIGWAVWSWTGIFAVADSTPDRHPDRDVCRALGLTCN